MTKIREGYKDTEIGVIPNDWEISKVEDLSIRVCVGFVGTCSDSYTSESDGIPMIRTTNLTTSGVDLRDLKFVTHEFHSRNKKSQLKKGDILVARHGSNGKASLFDYDFEANSLNIVIIRPKNDLIDSYYFKEFFNSNLVATQVANKIGGSVQSVINTKAIATIDIARPLLKEQQLIAEILSTTDALIEKLNKIIEDYQFLKKGMMKKLLTEGIGHTEFKETEVGRVPKEWEVSTIGSFGEVIRGVNYKPSDLYQSDNSKSIRLLRSNNIKDILYFEDLQFVDTSRVSNRQILQTDDIVICMSNGSKALVGKSSIFPENQPFRYTIGAFCASFRVDSNFNKKFMHYLFSSDYFHKGIRDKFAGTSINNLKNSDISEIKIPVPSKDEQSDIAFILQNIDLRISIFREQYDEFILLKKSLLEKLMTGKIRVNISELEA